MFNYITDLSTINENEEETIDICVSGHDMQSLLYAYMDELLFHFSSDSFCCKRIEFSEFDLDSFLVKGRG
jgi:SHS2 domain-containing protein